MNRRTWSAGVYERLSDNSFQTYRAGRMSEVAEYVTAKYAHDLPGELIVCVDSINMEYEFQLRYRMPSHSYWEGSLIASARVGYFEIESGVVSMETVIHNLRLKVEKSGWAYSELEESEELVEFLQHIRIVETEE